MCRPDLVDLQTNRDLYVLDVLTDKGVTNIHPGFCRDVLHHNRVLCAVIGGYGAGSTGVQGRFDGDDLQIIPLCRFPLDNQRTVDVLTALHRQKDSSFPQDRQDGVDHHLSHLFAGGFTDVSAADFTGATSQHKNISGF